MNFAMFCAVVFAVILGASLVAMVALMLLEAAKVWSGRGAPSEPAAPELPEDPRDRVPRAWRKKGPER